MMSASARRNIWIAVAVVAAVAILVGGTFAYQAVVERRAASAKIDQATALIEKADAVVVDVDEVVSREVTPELAGSAQEAVERVPEAVADLEEAVRLIDAAIPDLAGDAPERANLLKQAAVERLDMLEQAPLILEYNRKAARALQAAEQAWNHTLEAVKLSEQAVAEYNKLNKAGVEKSAEINRRVASELASATALFGQAAGAFPEANLDQFGVYAELRAKLSKLSADSDKAWLAGDPAKANEIIKVYNAEDKRAIEQAKKLPPNPRQAIATAYDEATAAAVDLYYAARERATQADERLRTP